MGTTDPTTGRHCCITFWQEDAIDSKPNLTSPWAKSWKQSLQPLPVQTVRAGKQGKQAEAMVVGAGPKLWLVECIGCQASPRRGMPLRSLHDCCPDKLQLAPIAWVPACPWLAPVKHCSGSLQQIAGFCQAPLCPRPGPWSWFLTWRLLTWLLILAFLASSGPGLPGL